MAAYERFDVVKVPFPFTDRQASKTRPALILSGSTFNKPAGHSVLAMITSVRHTPWPLDVSLQNLTSSGLPVPSLVRMKLFTLDHRLIISRLGCLDAADAQRVTTALTALLSA